MAVETQHKAGCATWLGSSPALGTSLQSRLRRLDVFRALVDPTFDDVDLIG